MKKHRSLGTRLRVGDASSAIFVGGLTNIPSPEVSAEEIDVTTLDSDGGFREHIQGFKDGGEISLEGFLATENPGTLDAGQQQMYDLLDSGDESAFAIVFPDAIGFSWNFRGFVNGFSTNAEVDGALGFSTSIRVTGKPTFVSTQTSGTTGAVSQLNIGEDD
ncbi:MAG: phage tail tube protein [Defluviitaleaceae bacterium]|nr:phage tail tube protein [Defluviitaleaceae bacterium]MCL2263777.1 phage tail tube protein [Defluviitaleaceae bacterium]